METALPTTVHDITPAFLSSVLGRPVATVKVEQIAVGEGFVGQLARLTLDDDSTLIAKLPTADPGGQFIGQLLRLWEREHRFYTEVAPQLSIRTARCYASLVDGDHYVLLLEDLAPARAGDQVVGATIEEARKVIDYIARFHAQWWAHPMLDSLTWMPRIDDPMTKMVTPMFVAGWEQFKARFAHVLPPRTLEWAAAFGPTVADFLDLYVNEPVTMIHGDFRLDNIMFSPDGSVTLLDWQMTTRAPGLSDIVYFTATNLDDDVRAAHLDTLLRLYCDVLSSSGVVIPSFDEVLDGYRKGILMWMVAMAGGIAQLDPANERGVALFDKMIGRLYRTADAIDAGRFLPEWLNARQAP
jgi:hypothetical protein